MPEDPVLAIDHPLLARPSADIAMVDASICALADEMFAIMDRFRGAGLAAVQIGRPVRLVVMDTEDSTGQNHRLAMVNAEIVWRSDEKVVEPEGCLSMPDYDIPVRRHARLRVRFTDLDGREQVLDADGPLAICVQHEIDHTEGVLFYDRVSRLRRDRARAHFAKVRRGLAS